MSQILPKEKNFKHTQNYHIGTQQKPAQSTKQKNQQIHSQFIADHYEPKMNFAQRFSIEQIKQKLAKCAIQYDPNKYVEFTKFCVKTDWESTEYLINYGGFVGCLRVIVINSNTNLLECQRVGQGSFGSVWKCQLSDGRAYALKDTQIKCPDPKFLDFALKQIFLCKIFSALEIGPKYSQILTYDAIQYNKTIEYAMQLCQTAFTKQQLEQQQTKRQLIRSLKIMHSLNICHRDIKLDNLGWSELLGKFVLLDFNCSQILEEPVGFKSLARYAGTFLYCSDQVRKLRLLDQANYVDLYYNDLHCLEKTYEQMNKMCKASKIHLSYSQRQMFNQKKPGDKKVNNFYILQFFQMKMKFQNLALEDLTSFLSQECVLLKTFRRILLNKNQKSQIEPRYYNELMSVCNQKSKTLPPESRLTEIDNYLAQFEYVNRNKVSLNSICTTINRILSANSLLMEIWEKDEWKEQIFQLVDVYSDCKLDDLQILRKKLIKKVYEVISNDVKNEIEPSITLKFRQVLIYFFGYFYRAKNIGKMRRILVYFIIMDDRLKIQEMQDKILQFLKQNGNWVEYFTENFKYFTCKLVLAKTISSPYFPIKFLNNFELLLIQQAKNNDSLLKEILSAVQKTVSLMKILEIEFQLETNSDKTFYNTKDKFQAYLLTMDKYFSNDLKKFLEIFINYSDIQNGKEIIFELLTHAQNSPCEDQLIQKYMLKIQFISGIFLKKEKINKTLLKKQKFTREFHVIYHGFAFEMNQVHIKDNVWFDYCQIPKKANQIPSNIEIMLQSFTLEGNQKQLINLLNNFKLDEITNVYNLTNWIQIFEYCLSILIDSKFQAAKVLDKYYQKVLLRMLFPFLKFCQKTFSVQPKNNKNFEAITGVFEISLKTMYLVLNLFKQEKIHGLIILEKLVHRYGFINNLGHLICYFGDDLSQKSFKKRQDIINYVGNLILKQRKFYRLFQPMNFLFTLVQSFARRKEYNTSLVFILQFSQELQRKDHLIFKSSLIHCITQFVYNSCPISQLYSLTVKMIQKNIKQFEKFPVATCFLAYSYFRLQKTKLEIQGKLKQRLLKISVLFFSSFSEGILRKYKSCVLKEAYKLKNMPSSKKIYEKRDLISTKILMSKFQKIGCKKDKSKHWRIFYDKYSTESALEKLRRRIKALQFNKKENETGQNLRQSKQP